LGNGGFEERGQRRKWWLVMEEVFENQADGKGVISA
jgi:hypothetical protein